MRSATSVLSFKLVRVIAAAVLAASLGWASGVSAQISEGPNSPGAVVSDASFGTSPWFATGNAAASDNSWAQGAPAGLGPTQYLKATTFGFAIPAPAQIVGIEATIERHSNLGTIKDSRVRIVKGGIVGATERALAGTWPIGTDATVTYGGSSDLWGETWTPADINAGGFGLALSVTDSADLALVDHMTLKVYYSLCADTPAAGCKTAAKSIFLVKDKTPDSKDKLIWKWIKGLSTPTADFADPLGSARYALCVYAGPTSTKIGDALVQPGAGWSNISTKGFKYLDKTASQTGIQKIIVKGSVSDKAKALVKGKGAALPDIAPPLALPVKVQLVNSGSGECWEGEYDTPDIKKNETGQFKAKAQ